MLHCFQPSSLNATQAAENHSGSCLLVEQNTYTGEVCRNQLHSCLPTNGSTIYISPDIDQKSTEEKVLHVTEFLETVGASEQCTKAATLFFCLVLVMELILKCQHQAIACTSVKMCAQENGRLVKR